MLWFLRIQAAAAALLTLAVLLAARNPRDGIGVAALAGIAGLVIAVLGEATANAARLVPLNRYSAAGTDGISGLAVQPACLTAQVWSCSASPLPRSPVSRSA